MDASTFVYESGTWYGKFRELFLGLGAKGKIVEDPNARPGEEPGLDLDTTRFSGLDEGERTKIYHCIDDCMELLTTVKRESPYWEECQEDNVMDGVNTLIRNVGFLANVFGDPGPMTAVQLIENQARFESFMQACDRVIVATPGFYETAGRPTRTYGKGGKSF